MFNMEACGARIKELRKKKNMTREQLAEDLHISTYHLRRMESGNEGGSIDLLIDIADYFGITLDHLILGKSGMPENIKTELLGVAYSLIALSGKI